MTFIQRFGDALNLNLHFHTLALDGVFEPGECPRFRPLPPPEDEDVERIALRTARGLVRLLERRGLGLEADPDEADPLCEREPWLAALYSAAVRGRVAMGPRVGQRPLRFGDRVEPNRLGEVEEDAPRCVRAGGLGVHADVAVPANDRDRLERLCRYVARPPLATERLSQLQDGRLLYRLRHRWRDGTTHVVFEPLELMERLAALVPAPRGHQVRYHGILAPAAPDRSRVVPAGHGSCAGAERKGAPPADDERARPEKTAVARARRYAWAELMRRVFEIDVLECPRCAGRMRILAAIHPPDTTVAILKCLGLPTRAPPLGPAVGSADDAVPFGASD